MRTSMILLLLLLALLPIGARAESMDTHTIFIATDMHYISPSLTDHGEYFSQMAASGDGKVIMYSEELMEAFVEQVIAAGPDCLILSGDITFNGARQSHEDLAAKLQRIQDAGIPVYVLPGNHDLNSRNAASFSGASYTRLPGVTQAEFESIYQDFGFGGAIACDPHSLSYIAEPFPGLRVLMLDVNTPGASAAVPERTFAWLEEQLSDAKSSGAKVISVSHQNLFAHSSMFTTGYVLRNARRIRAMYDRHGVKVNLSGHMHIQHSMESLTGFLEIATSSLAVSPCQYGVITVVGDQAQYRSQTVDVSAWAARSGRTDENLLHFAEFADSFFKGTGRQQTRLALDGAQDPDAALRLIGEINAAYFSGRLDTLPQDISPLAEWLSSAEGFFPVYLGSILNEKRVDHTKLDFAL